MATKISQIAAIAALTAMTATAAHAGLVGRTLQATYYFPDLNTPLAAAVATPGTFTVGPAVETTIDVDGATQIKVDFTDTSVRFDFTTTLNNPSWSSSSFNGVVFDLLAGDPDPLSLASASIDSSSTLGGFTASRVGLGANQLTVDWNGLSYVNGTSLLINFTSAPSSVPEPGSLALLAMALAAWAYIARPKHARAAPGTRT